MDSMWNMLKGQPIRPSIKSDLKIEKQRNKLSSLDNYDITIHWIRHGESCANLGQHTHKDKIDATKNISKFDNDDLDDKLKNDEFDLNDVKIFKKLLKRKLQTLVKSL